MVRLVPAKGLLVSGMAIPMLTFYNHHKMWRYDSNLKDIITEYGFLSALGLNATDYRIWKASQNAVSESNSDLEVNLDARLSVTYEWNSLLFLNIYGQFSNFKFKMDNYSGHLNDWYINASLGLRL